MGERPPNANTSQTAPPKKYAGHDGKASKKGGSNSKTAVLGREVLAAYAQDRANMELPSWMSHAPIRAGHTEHGKLSADQWRSFCSVHLPVTLIRKWGGEGPDSRFYQMLTNFLDLVIAVEIASNMVTSPAHISLYKSHMTKYLVEVKNLYKEASVTPNHHMALHIDDFLELYGPAPGTWIFHMERANHDYQEIPTNGHFGTADSFL